MEASIVRDRKFGIGVVHMHTLASDELGFDVRQVGRIELLNREMRVKEDWKVRANEVFNITESLSSKRMADTFVVAPGGYRAENAFDEWKSEIDVLGLCLRESFRVLHQLCRNRNSIFESWISSKIGFDLLNEGSVISEVVA